MKFRISEFEQNTIEWFEKDRLGKVTASILNRVITPTGKLSTSRDEVVNRAVAELIMKTPDDSFQSDSMLRGKILESEALDYFNFVHGFNFKKSGFLHQIDENGNETGYGLSPDAVDFFNMARMKSLELKCPEPHTHLGYLAAKEVPKPYFAQTQAPFILGIHQVFFGSYHPDLPCFQIEVKPDDEWLKAAEPIIKETCQMIKEKFEEVTKMVEAAS